MEGTTIQLHLFSILFNSISHNDIFYLLSKLQKQFMALLAKGAKFRVMVSMTSANRKKVS